MTGLKATKEGGVHGMELLNELSAATGLPDALIGEELSRIVASAGKTTDSITLDELREMLASYLQDVLLDAKDSFLVEVSAEASMAGDFSEKKMATEAAIQNETASSTETVIEFSSYRALRSVDFIDGD